MADNGKMKAAQKIDIAWEVLTAHLFQKRVPLSVYLHLTDRCQLHCKYCNIPANPRQELSTRQLFSLMDQIYRVGAKRVHLNGGEPLMREDIGDIVGYAKKLGLYVSLSSNGYLVPERIRSLKGLDILFLSFDGDKEAHDAQRGEGSYARVIEAFRSCRKNGIKFLTTTVLTRNNADSIAFVLEKAKEYRFAANFQVLYYPAGCHLPNSVPYHPLQQLLLPKEEYRKIFRMLINEKNKRRPVVNSYAFLKYLLDWENYERIYSSEEKSGIRCWAGKLYCWVEIDGSVYPCYDCIGRMPALNFLDVGFAHAFRSLKEGACRGCILSCYTEMNLMFSLNPRTIFNYLKFV